METYENEFEDVLEMARALLGGNEDAADLWEANDLVNRAIRTRASAPLCLTRTSPSSSSDRSNLLRYPESRPSRVRNARTSHPSAPISHSTRACPSGRSRDR